MTARGIDQQTNLHLPDTLLRQLSHLLSILTRRYTNNLLEAVRQVTLTAKPCLDSYFCQRMACHYEPLRVWELAGWDFILAASQYLTPTLESSTEISAVLKEKVARGELGVKTGKGFYEWTPESVEALKKRIGQALATIAQLS
jgi:3-hydroxyacyl-CoA dehydrogenase